MAEGRTGRSRNRKRAAARGDARGRQTALRNQRGGVWDPRALTGKQLASLVGVSGQAVAKWRQRGCPRGEDRRYDLRAVWEWMRRGAVDVGHLPQHEVVRIVGVSKQALAEWQRRGCPRNADGTYDAGAVVQWRTAELEKRIRAARDLSAVEKLKLRRGEVDLRRAEMDLAEREGEMVPRSAMVAGLAARYQTIKASLQAMIGRLRGHGFGGDQVRTVEGEIRGVLERLAGGLVGLQLTDDQIAALDGILGGGAVEPAAEEPDA